MNSEMRRDFADRRDIIAYLKETFPSADKVDDQVAEQRGGRRAAEAQLASIDPVTYEQNRNHLHGAVTRLSAYIRHGVLSLAEVRATVAADPRRQTIPGKLIQELGWRDYFRRVYARIGQGIWQDREPYKTGFAAPDYADALPEDIQSGRTGLLCIDSFSKTLTTTGYLHNHARMWLAAYIVHWRRVKWQAGARWFLQHLLDGDPASNNLSWQWVASTFSHKPYFFNRENVEKFSQGSYCQACPLYGRCDFEGSYPALEQRLFPNKTASRQELPGKRQRKQGRKRWHQ